MRKREAPKSKKVDIRDFLKMDGDELIIHKKEMRDAIIKDIKSNTLMSPSAKAELLRMLNEDGLDT